MKSNPHHQTLYIMAWSLFFSVLILVVVAFLLFVRWEQSYGTCSPTALVNDISRAIAQGMAELIKP